MKSKRLVTVTAGRLVSAVIYDQALPSDAPRIRAGKSKLSSQARAKINRRTSWQKLEALLAANFGPGDLWVTLSYDDEHLPTSWEEARKKLDRFCRRLRAARAARGETLRYVKNVENLSRSGSPTRWHHHLVLNGTGADYEEICAAWDYGSNVEIEQLGADGETYEDVARYMAKQSPPNSKNSWTPSRGLKRPQTDSELVPDNLTISPPPGASVLDRRTEKNSWGEFVYIKYLLPRRSETGRNSG